MSQNRFYCAPSRLLMSIVIAAAIGWNAPAAFAIPSLQLDIGGGSYNTTTQTVVTSNPSFTLYALLIPDAKALLTDTYYVSAALVPSVGTSNLGSFTFNGTTVNATSGMTFGVPPVDAFAQGHDAGDLAQHGIYPTQFKQFAFTFNPLNTATPYNTADHPGGPSAGTGMYYAAFNVNISSLNPNFGLHFDLYNTEIGKNAFNDTDIKSFAPFSHDAQANRVPIPGTLLPFGLGLIGLVLLLHRQQQIESKHVAI